jgi:hypothetical protein
MSFFWLSIDKQVKFKKRSEFKSQREQETFDINFYISK